MESSGAKCCFSKREVELGGRAASTLSVYCFTTQQHKTFSRWACQPLAVARLSFGSSRLSSALSLTTLRVRRLVFVHSTWGRVSRLQSCFSLKKNPSRNELFVSSDSIWIPLLSSHSIPSFTRSALSKTLQKSLFVARRCKLTCASYRPSACTTLVFTLSAGRLYHRPDRHEPDVTETAPADGKCFFHFLTKTILPVLLWLLY